MKILTIDTKKRKIGDIGENEAVKLLKKKKYHIIERNYVAVGHEIDIICESSDTLVFVEVKARTADRELESFELPRAAVNKKKQLSIIRAASYYIGVHPSEKRKRFDVVEVYLKNDNGKTKVEKTFHIENAFNINSAYSYQS